MYTDPNLTVWNLKVNEIILFNNSDQFGVHNINILAYKCDAQFSIIYGEWNLNH